MKPLQFSQNKQWAWRVECQAEARITGMKNELEKIQKKHPLTNETINWKWTRKTIATLLTEYYAILFDPDNKPVFRNSNTDQLKNLTLLFPIDDPISIHHSTNFILLPLPIPTYDERHQRWQYVKNCPFLRCDKRDPKTDSPVDTLIRVNELVRDMDYSIDSILSSSSNIQWNKDKREWYQHTDYQLKLKRTNFKLWRTEARLWTYKYKDVPKRIAYRLPHIYSDESDYTCWYSLRDIEALSFKDKELRNRRHKEYFSRYRERVKDQQYIYNKFVLLEIPAQIWKNAQQPRNDKKFYKLEDYSRTYLTDTMFTWNEFWKYFDFSFTKSTKEQVIDYFIKHALPMNEYCPLQIKSGITKLKNMIKDYNKKHQHVSHTSHTSHTKDDYKQMLDSQLDLDSPYYQTWRGRPTREYFNTHWAKWYKPDWTVDSFETYDERETYKKSLDQLEKESLSSNNNINDTN